MNSEFGEAKHCDGKNGPEKTDLGSEEQLLRNLTYSDLT